MGPRLKYISLGLATAAIYIAGAKLGLRLAYVAEQVTVVWPPTGIALSAVLLFGPRIWPFIAIGAFIANITTDAPALTSLGIATGNTLEALVGAYLLRRIRFDLSIDRFRDVFGLIFLAAGISTTIAATIGVASLCISGIQAWQRFGPVWLVWFIGDGMGDVIFAPFILTLASEKSRRRLSTRSSWESITLLAVVVTVALFVFIEASPLEMRPRVYAVFPALIWAALRFGSCGISISTVITSTIAVLGTVRAFGPFNPAETDQSLIALELFMFVAAVTGLLMAASQSERQSAVESLNQSEQRYRSLVLASSQVVWSTDARGEVIEDLPTWRSFTGQTKEEIMGRGWMKKVHPDDLAHLGTVWERSLATGTSHENEFRVMAADGNYRHMFARAVPITGPEGRIVEWVGTLSDVTERKRAEQELVDSSRRKDEFLAMLAHELRNPLAPIRTAVEIIRSPKTDSGKIAWACEVMERQIKHMTRLVEDLLDVARITHGRVQLVKLPVDLTVVVRRSLDAAQGELEKKQLRLETHFSPGILPISADITRIEQVITNILNNAAKFTPSGGLISVRLFREDNWAVLQIRDTGKGIAPELLPRVFDLFTQGEHSLARTEGGLGIGLTLVQSLVRMHSGTAEARSAGPGLGSEFTVRLPLTDEVSPASIDSRTEHRAVSGRKRVLVVEDNADAAETLATMLRMIGHEPHVAHDGPTGVAKFIQLNPAVVLLDIGLPGMNGYEVAHRIRTARPNHSLRLIAITGYGNDFDRDRTKAAGFDQHLVKPVDPAVLEKLLSD